MPCRLSCAHGVEWGSVGVIFARLLFGVLSSTIVRVMFSVLAERRPSSEVAVMVAPLLISRYICSLVHFLSFLLFVGRSFL